MATRAYGRTLAGRLSGDRIVDSLSAKVAGCRLPTSADVHPVGLFGPACLGTLIYRDLFGRMLVTQAQCEDLMLVTRDPLFRAAPAQLAALARQAQAALPHAIA